MMKALPLILVAFVFTPDWSLAKESEEVAGGLAPSSSSCLTLGSAHLSRICWYRFHV